MGSTLHKLVKTGIAQGMHGTGLDRIVGIARGLKGLPLVIGYHRVVENFQSSAASSIAPLLISVRTFERHLDWIGRRYDFVSLDELVSVLEGSTTRSRPVAAITFDDGYGDIYWNAYPMLSRKGIPSAVFVVTELVGTARLHIHDELFLLFSGALSQWHDAGERLRRIFGELDIHPSVVRRLCEHAGDPYRATRLCLENLPWTQLDDVAGDLRGSVEIAEDIQHGFHCLSWEELAEMQRHGVTVGAHTKSHAVLVNESWQSLHDEIRGSRQALERHLAAGVSHFAYPDGRFNEHVVKAVVAAGFRSAYTTCMHRDRRYPLLTIPRRMLWENSSVDRLGRFSPALLSCQVNGIFDPAYKCHQRHWV